jgi:sigma-E factor negative regulatory protein RseB
MNFKLPFCVVALMMVFGAGGVQPASAQVPASAASAAPAGGERSVGEWLLRLHEASRRRAYQGTFVVSSASGAMSSARIWHVCDGEQQMERVETLTGAPRSIFRRNDQVVTFLPEAKVARTEKRDSLGLFPNLLKSADNAIPEFYSVRQTGSERVAGLDADIVQFVPRDAMRFGYRLWSEKKTGLVIKLQTLDASGRVLEQSAFSELQLDAPVKLEQLAQMMARTSGYRLEKAEMLKTTAAAEGWSLRNPVAGFRPMSCFKRPASGSQTAPESTVQWVFSDGLASVSLFVEVFDRQRHLHEGVMTLGATQTLTRHLGDRKDGGWWLTAVGEVPVQTLQAFAQGLEHQK